MKVAVIGAGISGLACAYLLARAKAGIDVTLFEANGYFGGHTNTVDVTLDGITHGVDTGFLVRVRGGAEERRYRLCWNVSGRRLAYGRPRLAAVHPCPEPAD